MTGETRLPAPGDEGAKPLRSRAEALLARVAQLAPGAPGSIAEHDALHLLHELQVHHVELQLQNEELEQARAEAIAAGDRYARLFELAPVAVLNLTLAGHIVQANRAAAALLGQGQEALQQRTLRDFLAPESQEAWQMLLERAEAATGKPADLQLKRTDAGPCSVQAQLAHDLPTQSVLVTLTDVSERERVDKLQRAALTALERALQVKNDFLSRMSHELRTPMNAVLGFSHLQLIDTVSPLSAIQRHRAEHIQRAGQHLLSLIEDALDVASIEAGRFAVSLEVVDVGAVVAECLSMIEPQAQALDLHVSGLPSGAPQRRVIADARRLRQVLLNLLSNAIKYNRPGGEVRLSCGTEASPDRVSIVVADTGMGIAEEQQERLFSPFDRLGAERTAIEGTGLGLSIARLLVQAMAGTLEIESHPGSGTVVTVALPAAPEDTAPAGAPDQQPASSRAQAARVLYIDGNQASRSLMGGVMAGIEGASLEVAPDGLSGLARAQQRRPAIVIADVDLPDIDGISVLRSLRQSPDTRDCYFVALSADATNEAAAQMRAHGVDEFWPKPSGVDFMRRRLAELLHRG